MSNKTNSNLKPNDKTKTIEKSNTAKWKWNEREKVKIGLMDLR